MKIALCAPADLHALARFCGRDTTQAALGLGGTATTPLLCEFLRRGHRVTLYTLSKDVARDCLYQWDNLRIFVGRFRARHLAGTYYWPEIEFLRKTIRADAPGFVHAHWTYEFALGALRSGVPTLTTIHDLPWNVLRYYRDAHRAARVLMACEVGLRGKYFSAVSSAAARHFARYIRPGAEIAIIPNGLSHEVFAMAKQGRVGNQRAVTFATVLQGWSRRKNAQAALQAFGLVRRELTNMRLLMFGSEYEPNGPAQRWAEAHALDRSVVFAGPIAHNNLLQRISEDVDVVVHPSRDEAFSMAALETLGLRKALIAGETTPGMREMLGQGGGMLVDVQDPAAIAQAMLHLANNADYRRHLANHGFERALHHYRLSTIADEYENFYRAMLMGATASCHDGHAESRLSADV